jgi:hypothetical protein
VDLTLRRNRPGEALRVWTGEGGPLSLPPGSLGVEWAGRLGHPSSYALLGGSLAPQPEAHHGSETLNKTLAGRHDRIHSGFVEEYREAVEAASQGRLHVTAAAHGEIGSSPAAFARVATLLCNLLEEGVPNSDDALWQRWEASA